MDKILFITNRVPIYRHSFFLKLGERFPGQITVAHSGKAMFLNCSSITEFVLPRKQFFGLLWQRDLKPLIDSSNIVISLFDIHYLSSIFYFFKRKHRDRWIWWGIGFGRSFFANKIKAFLAKKSNGIALYMKENLADFIMSGVPEHLLSYVPNTIEIKNPFYTAEESQRTSFLFFGSLKRRKRADLLLKAFTHICNRLPSDINLDIIGDGECRLELEAQAGTSGYANRIHFHGAITDETLLKPFFAKAIGMVSPGQAGLSILHSFASGVPVITARNAISGGELINIRHKENGLFFNDVNNWESLGDIMLFLAENKSESTRMGKKAFEYYCNHMTLDHFVNAFSKLIYP